MRWERELGDALRELARSADEVPENPGTEQRLMDAFDNLRGAGLTRGAGLRAGGSGWYLAAAASLALLAGGGSWMLSQRPAAAPVEVVRFQEPPVVEAARPLVQPTEAAAPATDAASPAMQDALRTGIPPEGISRRSAASTPPRAVAPTAVLADTSEETEEFVELPAAARLPRFESGMVVRVELPASSLPAYGFPIMPDGARKPVTADVLVGQDGQPRAIRLVSMQSRTRSYR
jgi:hypothetical protein